jgi:hypothetical protein
LDAYPDIPAQMLSKVVSAKVELQKNLSLLEAEQTLNDKSLEDVLKHMI